MHPPVLTPAPVAPVAALGLSSSHCWLSAASFGELPRRAQLSATKPRENKDVELPAACQIQSERPEDGWWLQSEASQWGTEGGSGGRGGEGGRSQRRKQQAASARMANRAARVT